MDATAAAVESLPMMHAIQTGKEWINRKADKVKGKVLEKALTKYGIPPSVAKEASKKLVDAQRQQRDAKRNKRKESANRFMNNVGLGGKEGIDFKSGGPNDVLKHYTDPNENPNKELQEKLDRKNKKGQNKARKKMGKDAEKKSKK